MTFEGAVIKEQGINFAVVIVKQHVLNHPDQAQGMIQAFSPTFGGIPVVLIAQDASGRAIYYGRQDISKFLSGISMNRIPWRRYSLRN